MSIALIKPAALARPLPPPRLSISLRRPLVDIVNAAFALDLTRDEILEAVFDGSIGYAFDLKCRNARQSFIRIWNRSLSAFYIGNLAPVPLKTVLESILPPGVSPGSTSLADALSVDGQHVSRLASDKLFKTVKAGRPGPGGAAVYERESICAFLAGRRVL